VVDVGPDAAEEVVGDGSGSLGDDGTGTVGGEGSAGSVEESEAGPLVGEVEADRPEVGELVVSSHPPINQLLSKTKRHLSGLWLLDEQLVVQGCL